LLRLFSIIPYRCAGPVNPARRFPGQEPPGAFCSATNRVIESS
jgi:hypothetical protein